MKLPNTLLLRLVLLACLVACAPASLLAQTATVSLDTQVVSDRDVSDGDDRDELQLTLSITATSTGLTLGNTQLVFTFNQDALELPAAPEDGSDFLFQNYSTTFYSAGVTNTGAANEAQANILLFVPNQGSPVPEGETEVVSIFFKISDASQTAGVLYDASNTQMTAGDNTTVVDLTFDDSGGDVVLPVELTAFTGMVDGTAALLRWQTASETNNAGFEVERRLGAEESGDATWMQLGFVDGAGTTLESQSYSHRVHDLAAGVHHFRLKQIDYDGAFEYSPEVEVSVGVLGDYVMSSAYPNPFNPKTQFTLAVARAQQVEVSVYNMLGQRVAVLHEGEMAADRQRVFVWEAGDRPSGLYFIRITGERFAETRQVMLVK